MFRADAELVLCDEEQALAQLFEDIPTPVYFLDSDGQILWANQMELDLLGYTLQEFVGHSFTEFQVDPKAIADMLTRLRRGDGLRNHEVHLRAKDGSIRYMAIDAQIIWKNGEILHTRCFSRDITDQKQAEHQLAELHRTLQKEVAARVHELEKKEAELLQALKLEAVGRLAGGVAHDFNNLILGIIGISREVQQTLDPEDTRHEDLSEVIGAAQRAFRLTRQLLTFARRQAIAPRVLQLNSIVAEMNKLLRQLIGEDIELLTFFQPNLSTIRVDPGQVEQVLMNLVLNARDAMPRGGTITIRTSELVLPAQSLPDALNLSPGRYVFLEVSDTGTGMNTETLQHIFEPFFTTKARDKGTGLGLSTVYGIVKQSGGAVHVDSRLGTGTTFKILFPTVADTRTHGKKSEVAEAIGGRETILVIEDQSIVSRVIMRKLRDRGYQVLQASDGQKAIDLSRRHKGAIDLILTDVVMPGMNGQEAVERIREERPEAKVIYMSGYSEDVIAHRGILTPGIHFIEKAAIANGLANKVRAVLDGLPMAATEEVHFDGD